MDTKEVYFISGIYGVGKSTLSEKVSQTLNLPFYTASDLIKRRTGEEFNSNKYVNDLNNNQNVLIDAVNALLTTESSIILVGHFCIINKTGGIDVLPESVYKSLYIKKIILLELEPEKIIENLNIRDKKQYDYNLILSLQEKERQLAKYIAEVINAPLLLHKMNYSDEDVERVVDFIKKKNGKR